MSQSQLSDAVARVPPGRWAIGVSGGADSVALLELLRARSDLSLHVAHLDHETRGEASTADAEFVRELAERWKLPATIARRSEIESHLPHLHRNLSERFRQARLTLFRQVVQSRDLEGVILAHHADDQAETVLQRLLRGSGRAGLAGMSHQTRIGGLLIIRPMLDVRRETLRAVLIERSLAWREDASNESDTQQRNRARRLLAKYPTLTPALLDLSRSSLELTRWFRSQAPVLPEQFAANELADLSPVLARESARRWLAERAIGKVEIPPKAVEQLMRIASDAATAPRWQFPGGVYVLRRKGMISAAIMR